MLSHQCQIVSEEAPHCTAPGEGEGRTALHGRPDLFEDRTSRHEFDDQQKVKPNITVPSRSSQGSRRHGLHSVAPISISTPLFEHFCDFAIHHEITGCDFWPLYEFIMKSRSMISRPVYDFIFGMISA